MTITRKSIKGFTLIELMVVVLIISLITVVAVYSITKAQKRGRDTRRKADISMIQGALESFYSQNKYYPTTEGASGCGTVSNWDCDWNSSANSIWIQNIQDINQQLGVDKLGRDPLLGKAGAVAPANNGPIYAGEETKGYYGYYSANANFSPTCTTLSDSCPYKSLCQSNALTYNVGEYYILSAILENDQDKDRLGATDNHPYYLDCTDMSTSGSYNSNAYVKIKVF